MNLCVIPARGGSKRIKKKNIKSFCGKPIIAWSIQQAIKSKCFDKIIVSTDDNNIAKLAISFGAEVPFLRPKKLSDDYTGTVSVISHAVKWQIKNDLKPTYVCCIYATAPFINISELKNGLKILKKSKFKYVFSATNYSYPIQRSFRIKKNKKIEMFYPKNYKSRSQDLDVAFHDAGQFYWGQTDAWLKNKPIISKSAIPILIPRSRVHDIDTHEDWRIAETMFKQSAKL
ncbi:pseudaminic acid cytidylyltransferase [Pelagibacterales bacterium SAG-MED34]|nr:pseudaminic acid cytidylyltransferase [Pelagibacterales bacterium SAG-MED34]